jgi:hypothetical protein
VHYEGVLKSGFFGMKIHIMGGSKVDFFA